MRVIISGGGTGGHIFPAISIAGAIKARFPDAEILFVGAEGRMEMQRVPDAGYPIVGLPVCGFDRKNLIRNFLVVWKALKSVWKARQIVKDFAPTVAVGVGGYASGPTLQAAAMMNVPTLIQEQNSYAGVTNRLLARSAKRICVAYTGMERFFPAEKLLLTGNPIRKDMLEQQQTREDAVRSFGFDPEKPVVLVLGGSLGARQVNESILGHLDLIRESGVQFVWQTGKFYYKSVLERLNGKGDLSMLYVTEFISRMSDAYAAADLVISRAGAGSISEFCALGKPVILVPSPNVSEDHQTKNALALVQKGAALHVTDADAPEVLLQTAIDTVRDSALLESLSRQIAGLGMPDAADVIAREVAALSASGTSARKK